MKQCPQCRQTFSDDTIFCLFDGTPLVFINDSPEEVTVVNPNQEEVTVFKPTAPTREDITVVSPVRNTQPFAPPARQGVSPIFAYLSVGLLVLLILGGIVLAGVFFISRMSGGNTNTEITKDANKTDNGQNKIDEEQAKLRQQQEQIERERQRLANERKKLEEEKNKPVPTPSIISTPPPPTATPPPSYPPQPTARIKFGRGRVAESVSGKVYTQRSFVLEARSGQYLSASVSGGGCVTFSNGGTSIGYNTTSGDNRLTLVNNCDREASFSMTVAIR